MSETSVLWAVVAGVQASFAVLLLPAILNRTTRVPAITSGLTALLLGVLTVTFFFLGSSVITIFSTAIVSLGWAFLFFFRSGFRITLGDL